MVFSFFPFFFGKILEIFKFYCDVVSMMSVLNCRKLKTTMIFLLASLLTL